MSRLPGASRLSIQPNQTHSATPQGRRPGAAVPREAQRETYSWGISLAAQRPLGSTRRPRIHLCARACVCVRVCRWERRPALFQVTLLSLWRQSESKVIFNRSSRLA